MSRDSRMRRMRSPASFFENETFLGGRGTRDLLAIFKYRRCSAGRTGRGEIKILTFIPKKG